MRVRSVDTPLEIERMRLRRLRELEPSGRLAAALELDAGGGAAGVEGAR